MKIFCHGGRSYGTQIDRIEKGLLALGHNLTESLSEAEIIYSNDSSQGRDEIIQAIKDGDVIRKDCKTVFNVLDVPEWNMPNVDLQKMGGELTYPNKVTSISKFVQRQLKKYFEIESDVIYNPIKEIDPIWRTFGGGPIFSHKVAMVGRLRDASKRANLAVQSLILAGYKESDVAIVGSEPIGWGHYLGVITDDQLRQLYISVDFVVMTSLGEGLGLPALEGCVAGAVPVVCHDLTTFNEFYPPEFGNYPNPYAISEFMKRNQNLAGSEKIFELGGKIEAKLNHIQIARNIIAAAS